MFWIIGWTADFAGGPYGAVLTHLSILEHNDSFAKGVLDTKDVIYYLNFTALALFLTLRSLEVAPVERLMLDRLAEGAFWVGLVLLALAVVQGLGARFGWTVIGAQWSWLWWPLVIVGVALVLLSFLPLWRDPQATLSARGVRYGVNTLAVVVLLVLGVIGVVEALSYRHNSRDRPHREPPAQPVAADDPDCCKGSRREVNAVAFYRSDQPGKRVVEDLFKQYARYAGDKFTWKIVDPDREPALARALRRRDLRHDRAGDQGALREGAGRRPGGEAHQRRSSR